MAKASKSSSRESIQVHLDAAELDVVNQVGWLHRDTVTSAMPAIFEYEENWLASPKRFMLDPRLDLYQGDQYPDADSRGFGIFLDSAPDRWGRMLMERREAVDADREKRPMRTLHDVDFLLGVHDTARMGALRFRSTDTGLFLANHDNPAPPVTTLQTLAAISERLEEPGAENLPEYAQWLAMLIAPGSSLGGARPKANFTDTNGELWFAKFPSREDRLDVGAWEYLLHRLAKDAGIWVPESRLESFSANYRTFCVQRFDRLNGSRRMFVSTMTLLERQDGQLPPASYIDIAEFLCDEGAQNHIDIGLAQLYRRVVFNVMTGNRDDHLRNHGFIRTATGWHLAPAFDMNPNPHKADHALTLDGNLAAPNLSAVRNTAELYRLTATEALAIENEVRVSVANWKASAVRLNLPRSEILTMANVIMQ